MSVNESMKPVGGVLSAELFWARDVESLGALTKAEKMVVEIEDDGSTYEERIVNDEGLVSVEHTLTLRSCPLLAKEWFDVEKMQILAVEGVVAKVVLASGEEIVVGYSERFGVEQALRLESLRFYSGSKPNDSPSVELKLRSRDLRSALSENI